MLREIKALSDFSLVGQPDYEVGETRFVAEDLAFTLQDRGLVEVLPIPPKPPVQEKNKSAK